ncbi:3'-5' exoribonuclease [Candidatus Peregrinibacteria bacterium]|nr:3'-5' exoribonuclease [Candidatus Peregrinibacteria bacterium]
MCLFISLDIETTGFDPKKDEPIEIAAVKFDHKKIHQTFSSLIRIEKGIPINISQITGITNEDLKNAPLLDEIKNEFLSFIEDIPIIGHNISFDTNFLRAKNIPITNKEYCTLDLAKILLPNQTSYSLEILTEILEIDHETKHRALFDALASKKLFDYLLGKIEEIPEEIRENIITLSKKSTWPLQNLFCKKSKNMLKNVVASQKLDTSAKEKVKKEKQETTLFPYEGEIFIKENIKQKTVSLIEIPKYDLKNLIQNLKKEKIIIAVSQSSSLLTENFITLFNADYYLCLQKLKKLKEKEYFEQQEITLLIKILLKEKTLKEGSQEEIEPSGKEYEVWNTLCGNESDCLNCTEDICFYKKALSRALKENCIVIPYSLIFKKLDLFSDKILIIDKGDVFYDQLRKILTTSKKINHDEKIQKEDENTVSWTFEKNDETRLYTTPKNPENNLKEALKAFKNVIFISENLTIEDKFDFFQKLLNLNDDIKTLQIKSEEKISTQRPQKQQKPQTPQIIIAKNLKPPFAPGNFNETLDILKQIIEKHNGSHFLLTTSQNTTDVLHKELIERIQGKTILSQKISGGTGKIISLFLKEPQKSLIIGNQYFLGEILRDGKSENIIQTLIIHRLPFEILSDHLIQEKTKIFKNIFEDFSIPLVVLRLKRIIYDFTQENSENKKIYILDSRFEKLPKVLKIFPKNFTIDFS